MFIVILALLGGCKPAPDLDASPTWAIDWASVTPTDGGLTGYQVWEFFVDGWEYKHEEDYYKCQIVQDLVGRGMACPGSVIGCVAGYELDTTVNREQTTCDATLTTNTTYSGPTRMAIGDLPSEIEADAPYDNWTLGWYVTFDDPSLASHGYAYAQDLESGQRPETQGWVANETYILWPAYAWEL